MQKNKLMTLGLIALLGLVSGRGYAQDGQPMGGLSGDAGTQDRPFEMAPPPPGPYPLEPLQIPATLNYQESMQNPAPGYPEQQPYEAYSPGYSPAAPQPGQFQQQQGGYGYQRQSVYPEQPPYEAIPPGYNPVPQSGQFQQQWGGYGYPQQPVYPGYMPYGYYPPVNMYR